MRKSLLIVALIFLGLLMNLHLIFSLRHGFSIRYGDEPSFIMGISGFKDQFNFKFNRLFEFVDSNANGRFDSGERILSVVALKQFYWEHSERQIGNEEIVVFEGTHKFGRQRREPIKINITMVISNNISLLLRIEKWKWQSTIDSKLCVEYIISGHHKHKSRVVNRGYEASFYGSSSKLSISINNTGIIDSKSTSIKSYSTENSLELNLPYFREFAQVEFLLNLSLLEQNLRISDEQAKFSLDILGGLTLMIALLLAIRTYKFKKIRELLNTI